MVKCLVVKCSHETGTAMELVQHLINDHSAKTCNLNSGAEWSFPIALDRIADGVAPVILDLGTVPNKLVAILHMPSPKPPFVYAWVHKLDDAFSLDGLDKELRIFVKDGGSISSARLTPKPLDEDHSTIIDSIGSFMFNAGVLGESGFGKLKGDIRVGFTFKKKD